RLRQGAIHRAGQGRRARARPPRHPVLRAAGLGPDAHEGAVHDGNRGRAEARARRRAPLHAGELTMTTASEHPTLAANPLVGVRRRDTLDAARKLGGQVARHPGRAARRYATFLREMGRVATGRWELVPDERDRRFGDAAWRENGPYRLLAQTYLAWGNALHALVEDTKMDPRDAERARFVVSLFVDAMAPTNALGGNPAAIKRALDTGGPSLLRGLENFVSDLARNGGMPAQVDRRKFAVGRNLATTEGSVVFRSAVLELIQYRPLVEKSHQRPLLIVPPQINKYYAFDLSP